MRLEANGLYKIQAGPFASGEEVDRAAERVLAELGIKAYKLTGDAPVAATAPAAPAMAAVEATPTPANAEPAPGLFASPAAAERLALAYQQDFGVKPYKISR